MFKVKHKKAGLNSEKRSIANLSKRVFLCQEIKFSDQYNDINLRIKKDIDNKSDDNDDHDNSDGNNNDENDDGNENDDEDENDNENIYLNGIENNNTNKSNKDIIIDKITIESIPE